jgi:hypothetical protein
MFQKLDLFPSSGEGRETPALLGPLEKAELNHWTTRVILTTAIYKRVSIISRTDTAICTAIILV